MKTLELHQMEGIVGGYECGTQVGLGVGLMVGGLFLLAAAATAATGGIAGFVVASAVFGGGLIANTTADCKHLI